MAKTNKKWYQKSRTYRYITQGIVFIFMSYIYLRHILFYDRNLEEYCPFGGLETIFSYITTGEFLRYVGMTNLVLFLLIVIITIIFRGGFCGWICPIGTVQDIVRGIGKTIGTLPFLKPLNKGYKNFLRNNRSELAVLDNQSRYIKYFILLFAVVGTWFSAKLLIRDYDLIIALIKILTFQLTIALSILVIFTLMSFFIDRPFCKYLCLMGATVNLIGKISPLRITRSESICTSCNLCSKSCPMNIDIAKQKYINSIDCNHCFNCIDACPTEDALTLKYFPKDLFTFPLENNTNKLGSEVND